jgi:hypothetical protein
VDRTQVIGRGPHILGVDHGAAALVAQDHVTAHLRSVVGGRLLSPPGRGDHTTLPTRAPLRPTGQHITLPAASPWQDPIVRGTDTRSAGRRQPYPQGTPGCRPHREGRDLLQTPPEELKEQAAHARPSRPAHHRSSCGVPGGCRGPDAAFAALRPALDTLASQAGTDPRLSIDARRVLRAITGTRPHDTLSLAGLAARASTPKPRVPTALDELHTHGYLARVAEMAPHLSAALPAIAMTSAAVTPPAPKPQ